MDPSTSVSERSAAVGGTEPVLDGGFPDLDRWYWTPVGRAFSRASAPLVERLLDARPGQLWLDAGAGTGCIAELVAARGAEVAAVDGDPAGLVLAEARATAISTTVAALEHLPFAERSFDGAACVCVLEFVSAPERVLGELARVLPDGAPLVLGCMHRASLWGLGRRLRPGRGGAAGSAYGRSDFADTEQIDELLARSGFALDGDWLHGVWWPPRGVPHDGVRTAFDRAGARLAPRNGAFVVRRARRRSEA